MFALCIESSHARGMGHFYRALNLAECMSGNGVRYKFYLNDHPASLDILQKKNIDYQVVPLLDETAFNWEREVVQQDKIEIWINDRLDTDIKHCQRVQTCNIPLVTFDDRGTGALLADLHIAALSFDEDEHLKGKRVLRGVDYLVLNPEIASHRRWRRKLERILITMGGADTYGVTVKVVKELLSTGRVADIVVGPGFEHGSELEKVTGGRCGIKQGVPSLIAEFERYDLAITGGGITPFEANASGLPCIVVANELFEIPVGTALADFGGAVFAGHHENLDSSIFNRELNVVEMSRAGLKKFTLEGAQSVVDAIKEL